MNTRLPTQWGVSLIELMVALVTGLAISAVTVVVYINSKHAFGVQDNTGNLQENGRFAMHVLREDLRLAGYWGLNYLPGTIQSAEPIELSNECNAGWATLIDRSIDVSNNTNAGYTGCIPDVDYRTDTDILTVRRADDEPTDDDDILAGHVYLRTSLTRGTLFIADSEGAVDAGIALDEAPVNNYRLLAHAYYVRPWSSDQGDGVPTLVRETISGGDVAAEPLVENIEDFQVTFGMDTDADGSVDRYVDDGMVATDIERLMTVTVEILVRARNVEADYTNTRTYRLGGRAGFTPHDGFRRQVFRETIYVRNRSLARILHEGGPPSGEK